MAERQASVQSFDIPLQDDEKSGSPSSCYTSRENSPLPAGEDEVTTAGDGEREAEAPASSDLAKDAEDSDKDAEDSDKDEEDADEAEPLPHSVLSRIPSGITVSSILQRQRSEKRSASSGGASDLVTADELLQVGVVVA